MKIVSRNQALETTLPRYFTGVPCRNGHISERYTVNHTCVECGKLICKRTYVKHSNKIKSHVKDKYWETPEKYREYQRAYRRDDDNKEKIRKRHRERYKNDIEYKITGLIRGHLNKMVYRYMGGNKHSVTNKNVGYSSRDLKEHIESQFEPGMSWENHGEWHIDHIIPLSVLVKWGVTDPSVVNALHNLRPLWAEDNMSKGARFIG